MEALTAIQDTREQDGYTLASMGLRVDGLQPADYSAEGPIFRLVSKGGKIERVRHAKRGHG